MRGRKPSTIAAGSSPVTVVPKPPAYMSKDAKAEWRVVSAIMTERKTLTDADLPSLENYCNAVGNMRAAQRSLNVDGIILPDGKKNPSHMILNNAQTTIRLCAGVLGLTPVDRSRPAVRNDVSGEDDDSPLNV